MKHCMITFRSVTPAQRAEGALRRAGIACTLQRTPRQLEEQGCGYCLRLRCSQIPVALEVLGQGTIPYQKIYGVHDSGRWEELRL